jgi:hypothetical protein
MKFENQHRTSLYKRCILAGDKLRHDEKVSGFKGAHLILSLLGTQKQARSRGGVFYYSGVINQKDYQGHFCHPFIFLVYTQKIIHTKTVYNNANVLA